MGHRFHFLFKNSVTGIISACTTC